MKVSVLTPESAGRIKPIVREELSNWKTQLGWDARPAIGMIEDYIRSGMLPGCLLVSDEGEAVGYSYYVVDASTLFLGGLFIREAFASPQNYTFLLRRTLESACTWRIISRIECQLFAMNCDLRPVFEGQEFDAVPRLFLTADLYSTEAQAPLRALPSGYFSETWDAGFLEPAALVIADSYVGSLELRICQDYRSRRGCLRYLRALVDTPSCGVFTPENTLCVFDSHGLMQGVLLTSRIAEKTAMVPQISVRKAVQGKGIGRYLLLTLFQRLRSQGFTKADLSVSEENQPAFDLYRALGFRPHKSFNAFVWEEQPA